MTTETNTTNVETEIKAINPKQEYSVTITERGDGEVHYCHDTDMAYKEKDTTWTRRMTGQEIIDTINEGGCIMEGNTLFTAWSETWIINPTHSHEERAMDIQYAIDSEMKTTNNTNQERAMNTTTPTTPTALDDLQVITRPTSKSWRMIHQPRMLPDHGKSEVMAGVLREALGEWLETAEVADVLVPEGAETIDHGTDPSDLTLRMVNSIIDPEGTSHEDDLATRLTSLFTSDEFCQRNFPELPGAHIRRLRWIAKHRGFNSVREALVAVSDGPRMKALRGLNKAEAIAQLDVMLNRRGLIKPDVVAGLKPIIDVMARSVREKNRKVSRFANKSHRSSLYTNRTILVWNGQRTHFTREFGAPSLMERCVEACYGQQQTPVAFQILNQDPERKPLPKELVDELNAAGILVIKEKAAIPVISDWVPMNQRKKLMGELWKEGALNMELVNRRDRKGRRYITPGAKWLMLTFDRSIDATYIPSLVTAPIEPSSFMQTKVVYADCCDHQGNSMGMDGGGWVPPFVDGHRQNNHQIRGMGMVDTEGALAYIKGEAFVKWDACVFQVEYAMPAPDEEPVSEWQPLWLDSTRAKICGYLGMTDDEFRRAYWDAAKAWEGKGYPKFTLSGEFTKITFQMTPVVDYNQVKGKAKNMVRDMEETVTRYQAMRWQETSWEPKATTDWEPLDETDIQDILRFNTPGVSHVEYKTEKDIYAAIRKGVDSFSVDHDEYIQVKVHRETRPAPFKPTTAFMGALRRETGFSTMSFCFEGQQFTRYQPGVDNDPSQWTPAMKAINNAQDELVARILDEGEGDKERLLDGLASRAAAQDEGIRIILSTLENFNAKLTEDKKIHWWNIPTLRSRIWRSLERLMYRGGDGGGIQCPQVVYQMCNNIPERGSVYTAAEPAQEVMTYRFPMATHTALCVVTTVDPMTLPELWEDPWGYVSPHRMVMNPLDLAFRMQGDDDGDKGGATTNQDIIAMAKDTWETRPVDIEVRASGASVAKYDEPMWSIHQDIPVIDGVPVVNPQGDDYESYTSGMELAARSRRGEVGRTTRLQQRLDAMKWQRPIDGDWVYKPIFGEHAIAMAWPNQGEIDCEKKLILPIDMGKVFRLGLFEQTVGNHTTVPGALIKGDDDVWRINPELVSNEAGRYDVDQLSEVVKAMLMNQGCKVESCTNEYEDTFEVGDPIEWCRSDKRVDLTTRNWEGSRVWQSGNLEVDSIMHWSFRSMEAKWWAEIAPVLGLKPGDDYGEATVGDDIDMADLLFDVMSQAMDTRDSRWLIRRPRSWWNDLRYKTIRTETGADAYAKALADAYKISDVEDQEEARASARARAATKQQEILADCTMQQYIDLWYAECYAYEHLHQLADRAVLHGEDIEARRLRRDAEKCINSIVRLINFPESKVARVLGLSEDYECPWLTRERREDIVAKCYDGKNRAKTFETLKGWIKHHGHQHTQVQGPDARPVHMTACPHCMDQARQSLVRQFRKDTQSATADYFKDLTKFLNGTGEYKTLGVYKLLVKASNHAWSKMGVNMYRGYRFWAPLEMMDQLPADGEMIEVKEGSKVHYLHAHNKGVDETDRGYCIRDGEIQTHAPRVELWLTLTDDPNLGR